MISPGLVDTITNSTRNIAGKKLGDLVTSMGYGGEAEQDASFLSKLYELLSYGHDPILQLLAEKEEQSIQGCNRDRLCKKRVKQQFSNARSAVNMIQRSGGAKFIKEIYEIQRVLNPDLASFNPNLVPPMRLGENETRVMSLVIDVNSGEVVITLTDGTTEIASPGTYILIIPDVEMEE